MCVFFKANDKKVHVWECGFELLSVQESLMHFLCSFRALWCRKNQNCWFQCTIFNLGLDILGGFMKYLEHNFHFLKCESFVCSDQIMTSFGRQLISKRKWAKNVCLRLFYINNISRSNDSLISALKIHFVHEQRRAKQIWHSGALIESSGGLPELIRGRFGSLRVHLSFQKAVQTSESCNGHLKSFETFPEPFERSYLTSL